MGLANRRWLAGMTRKSFAALEKAGVKVTRPSPEQRALFAQKARSVYAEVVPEEVLQRFLAVRDKYRSE